MRDVGDGIIVVIWEVGEVGVWEIMDLEGVVVVNCVKVEVDVEGEADEVGVEDVVVVEEMVVAEDEGKEVINVEGEDKGSAV